MILGVGCDIVEIDRIRKAVLKDNFINRCFTEKETEYFNKKHDPAESAAAGFAAKEAVSKALGTGISGFSFTDIEILHRENGQPYVNLTGEAAKIADRLGGAVSVSMSHSESIAVAYAVFDSVKQ